MLCLKNIIASCKVLTAVIIFIFTEAAVHQDKANTTVHKKLTYIPVPWLGTLTLAPECSRQAACPKWLPLPMDVCNTRGLTLVLPTLQDQSFCVNKNVTETVVPVILISHKTGIADAKTMAPLKKYNWKEIRRSIHVMFVAKGNKAWYAKVKDFILHPDFNEETLSTVALLILEYDLKNFAGTIPDWPLALKSKNSLYKGDQLFTIGYTNRNFALEQVVYRMDYVELSNCRYFYITEQLDTQWMRPKHYHCYNVRFSKEPCVFIPGMALIQYNKGKYTFIGISVWGPGCSLPARFIDFEQLVPWILSKMMVRRFWNAEELGADTFEDQHKWTLEKINDSKGIVLRPLQRKNREDLAEEIVHGECKLNDKLGTRLLYKEATNFTTRRRPNNAKIKAIAVYSLSLYDLNYNKSHYTCVQVLARCKQKSDSKLEFMKSEMSHPFQPYIKTLPVQDRDVYPSHVQTVKKTWDKYNYEILGPEVTQLIFRFEFIKEALIEVKFYGNELIDAYTKIENTTQSILLAFKPRFRRPYRMETKYPHYPYYYDKYGDSSTSTARTTDGTKKSSISPQWWDRWWHYHNEKQNWWLGQSD